MADRKVRLSHPSLEQRLAPGEWLFTSLTNWSGGMFEQAPLVAPLAETESFSRTWLSDEISGGMQTTASEVESESDKFESAYAPPNPVTIAMEFQTPVLKGVFVPATVLAPPKAVFAARNETVSDPSSDSISTPVSPNMAETTNGLFAATESMAGKTAVPEDEKQQFFNPQQNKPGRLEMGFTQTEIMIGVKAPQADALTVLAQSRLADRLDLDASYVILENDGVSLTFATLKPGVEVMDTVRLAQGQSFVSWAEPNEYVIGDARDLTPNDTNWANAGQYYHRLAQHELAWDIQTGNSSVIVAVTDDGVGYNHSDLSPNIWSNSAEAGGTPGVDDDGNGRIDDLRGWDFSGNDNNPLPEGTGTHGTHVSGIVAARTNNALGVAGTAGGNNTTPGISIMPVRWDGTSAWTAAVIANSFTYAANNGAKITTSSYNFDGFAGNNTVNNAFNYSYGKGVLHFVSAGNNNEFEAPRRVFEQTLFVGSHDSANVKSSFSNYGPFVDISGNGSSIYSTTTASNGTSETYSSLSGTSMSTPHAAGVAALIWSQNPTWNRDQVVAQMLGMADVVDAPNQAFINQLGTGRVNPYRALTETLPSPRFGQTTGLPADGGSMAPSASFSISVPMRLNPSSVTAANFELRGAGVDRQFDTADDVLVPLAINGGAAYMMGTNALTFAKSGGGNFASDRYRFSAFSGVSQLRDPFDTPLDGNADNVAGGNYVRTFTITGSGTNSLTGTIYEDRNGNGSRESYDAGLTQTTQPMVYIDANGNGTLDTNVQTFTSTGGAVTIPASGRVFVPLNVSGLSSPLTDVDVKLNITHPRLSDLDVFLVSPNGSRIELASDVGGNTANFINTVFNDSAGTSITAGNAPYSASYRPEVPLNRLNGESGNGGWLLEVVDDNPAALAGTTQVNDFSVIVSTPEISTTPDASGNFSFAALPAGTYTLRTTSLSGFATTGATSQSATIGDGETKTGLDFGVAKNNRIYSNVYTDANDNGTWTVGETGVAGRTVFIDLNSNGVLDKSSSTFTNTTVVPIPDNNGVKVYSDIAVSGLTGSVIDVNVAVNITHPYVADLNIFLVSPSGTRVELATAVGGAGDNFGNTTNDTVFDDEAGTLISAGTAPFVGSFRPEGLLSGVDGQGLNGTWRLEVQDVASLDIGQINKFSLTLQYGTGSNEQFAVTDSLGNAAIDVTAGTYSLINTKLPQVRPTGPTSSQYAVTAAGAPLYDRSFGVLADTTGPTIASTKVDIGTAQRSRVSSVALTFNELVTFTGTPTSAVTVTKAGGGTVGASATVDNSGPATILNITFTDTTEFGSILDGDYTIALNGAMIQDLAQNVMTGTPTTSFHRLYGDINGDRSVNGVDLGIFRNTFGSSAGDGNYRIELDHNADGSINGVDLGQFRNRFGQTLP